MKQPMLGMNEEEQTFLDELRHKCTDMNNEEKYDENGQRNVYYVARTTRKKGGSFMIQKYKYSKHNKKQDINMTPENIEKVKLLSLHGKSPSSISATLGITIHYIRKILSQ